jgi:hypothetical protein
MYRSVLQLFLLGIAGWHMNGDVVLCTSDCSRSNVGGDSLILKNCNSSHQSWSWSGREGIVQTRVGSPAGQVSMAQTKCWTSQQTMSSLHIPNIYLPNNYKYMIYFFSVYQNFVACIPCTFSNILFNKPCGPASSLPASYSINPGIVCQRGSCTCWLNFYVVILSSSGQMLDGSPAST